MTAKKDTKPELLDPSDNEAPEKRAPESIFLIMDPSVGLVGASLDIEAAHNYAELHGATTVVGAVPIVRRHVEATDGS